MRKLLLLIIFIVGYVDTFSQFVQINPNATVIDKQESLLFKKVLNQYDLVIGYSTSSYWSRSSNMYHFLAFKDGECFKARLVSGRINDTTWSEPVIQSQKVNIIKAKKIVNHLKNTGFFSLDRDSLDISGRPKSGRYTTKYSRTDGVNYRFEIIVGNELLIVESYEPEFFLEKMPELRQRAQFVKDRDWFLKQYKRL